MMLSNIEKKKKLAIYAFYEKDGYVDRYVEFFLEDLVKNTDKLVVVCNGILPAEQKKKLQKYSSHIIQRENNGFDIWGHREAFECLGWEQLSQYDEVITTNNTLMGPVYPFSEMFLAMSKKDVDFWGIARHYSLPFDLFKNCRYGYIPEHIQSYFIVFRKKMIQSKAFQEYWDNLPELKTYEDAVGKHEMSFTKYFEDQGFTWDTYVDTEDIKNLNANPIMTYPMLMIKEKKCPVFKRRSFFQDYSIVLDATLGQPAYDLYNFLKESTDYDVGMIWENVLRTCHQSDVAKNLHLDYILPSVCSSTAKSKIVDSRIALVAVLNNKDKIDEELLKIQSMPFEIDVFLITQRQQNIEILEDKIKDWSQRKVRVLKATCESIGEVSLLEDVIDKVFDYDFCCFYHDYETKWKRQGGIDVSRQYKRVTNILFSKEYVENIIEKFIEDPYLGMLVPPESNHQEFFSNIGNEWHMNYSVVSKILKRLDVNVPISIDKEPLNSGENVFWFRTRALNILKDKKAQKSIMAELSSKIHKEEVPGILRFFLVQAAGFYSAVVMTDEYARNELDNLRYYVRKYNQTVHRNNMDYGTCRDMVAHIANSCEGKRVKSDAPYYMRMADSLNKLLPGDIYGKLIHVKRKIFGPHDLVD